MTNEHIAFSCCTALGQIAIWASGGGCAYLNKKNYAGVKKVHLDERGRLGVYQEVIWIVETILRYAVIVCMVVILLIMHFNFGQAYLFQHLSQKVAVFYPTHTEEQQVDNVGLEPVSMRQRRPLLTSDARKLVNYLANQHTVRKLKVSTLHMYTSVILSMFSADDQNCIHTSTIYLELMKALCSQIIQPTKYWMYIISPTCWLLAMADFFRPSDVERVDLHAARVSSDDVLSLIIITSKEKQRGQRIVRTITIHPHCNPLLCSVAAFEAYKSRIACSICITGHPVFLNQQLHRFLRFIQDHNIPIGAECISHYIKQIMVKEEKPAQALVPKAHGLAVTLAAQAGVSVDNIVAHDFWSSRDIFEHYYRLSSATFTNFSVSTLDQQPRSRLTKCNVM
ncbi:hypothetical protein BCV71DRAFT_253862 [Rhizopus microsporus]|uniref:Uncharacterized protein n=2 Tax=Rhizopus TaxID=4842 RepID=A0A1X0S9N4_RHIZD|nr:hypothetical protein BCV71DRAFT_253862 [Rhizopus microsporus]